MKRTVAILAPLIDTTQFNMDFTLRLARNNRDLSLATFYELASEGFNVENISRGLDYGEDIPSAGFYLQGLLHAQGYDTKLTNKYDPETLRSLGKTELFAVCISTTMIITSASLLALFSAVRDALPGVPIIAGGVNVWKNYFQFEKYLDSPSEFPLQPEMLFHPSNAGMDANVLVVAQHGISSLLQVLKELDKGSRAEFSHIPNLCLPGGQGFVFTQIVDEKIDYNEDYTRWDLIDEMPAKIPLRTSIGCPYRCKFCDFCHLFPKIFLRSPASLSQELRLVKDRLGKNPGILHVSDDNVFITKKRLHEVCGAIEGSGLQNWVGFMRGGEYAKEELEAILRSGLRLGMIGVESGDQGQLDRMNKRQDIEKVKRGIEQFDAHGISVLMTFVVGFPGETRHTLQQTIDFLNNLAMTNLLVSYQVYPLLIFNLSEIAEPPARKKWQISGFFDQWSHSTMNSDEAKRACYDMFKAVTHLPYTYAEESHFFNRGMFTLETRRSLFQLRQQLTIKLIEKAPWMEIEPLLRQMAIQMELSPDGIRQRLLQDITVPAIEPQNR